MPEQGFREEVHNVILAHSLDQLGVISIPEILQKLPDGSRRMPDVLVEFQGLRTIIEGKINDIPNARKIVEKQAMQRVEEGLAHIGMAVLYPKITRTADSPAYLHDLIVRRKLEIFICSEAGTEGWTGCHVKDIGELLRRTFENLIKQNIIETTKAELEAAVSYYARAVIGLPPVLKRSALILGISELPKSKRKLHEGFDTNERESISKISALTIINAMIFQDILSAVRNDVLTLRKVLSSSDPISDFTSHWEYICDKINYVPIFQIARELLLELPSAPEFVDAIQFLGDKALCVLNKRAALKHDLMGRVYHTLLADKKYLATYYTSVSAATFLLKLALAPRLWKDVDWTNIKKLSNLRIADIACGTGTLLMAASEALTDNYILACVNSNKSANIDKLHKAYMEDIIYGYDVLTSALHLTASTLALRSSKVAFSNMNLFVLPHGGPGRHLGSIDFLKSEQIKIFSDTFHSDAVQVTKRGRKTHYSAPLPELDLCVINPPFTRSVGGNLLFGSMPDKERNAMQKELSDILRKNNISASSTAGLGSVFISIADKYLKVGGRMALVLPKTVLSGVAWGKTRELFKKRYIVEYIVSSHDPLKWNFSDNTNLSEVLIVAKKVSNNNNNNNNNNFTNDIKTNFVNLRRNPDTTFSTLTCARLTSEKDTCDIETGAGARQLVVGGKTYGEVMSMPWRNLREGLWMLPCAFTQASLTRVAYYLIEKSIYHSPRMKDRVEIPMVPLKELGELGPDRSAIHKGFTVKLDGSDYSSFWGHNTKECFTISAKPNSFLARKQSGAEKEYIPDPNHLWSQAGSILIAEGLRLNTQRVTSLLVTENVLSNVWWSLKTNFSENSLKKALILWLNSTPGIIVLLSHRGETEGPWIGFKKNNLKNMPVIDVNSLTDRQIEILSNAFDEIANEPIGPFPEMRHDPVRTKIDHAVLEAFDFPEIDVIRMLLAQEQIISLRYISAYFNNPSQPG